MICVALHTDTRTHTSILRAYVYVDFLPIRIHRVVHLLYVHCAAKGWLRGALVGLRGETNGQVYKGQGWGMREEQEIEGEGERGNRRESTGEKEESTGKSRITIPFKNHSSLLLLPPASRPLPTHPSSAAPACDRAR